MSGRPSMQQGPRPNVGWGYESANGLDPNGKTIRIKNLVLDTSEDDLRRIFSQLGAVADLWVVVDKYENQVGLAYCEFRDAQAVQIAVSHLNGVSFKGHQIQIEPTANHLWKNERSRILQAMEDMVIHRNGRPQYTEAAPVENQPSQDASSDLANLNSEQMFNLMHQMKLCLEASPDQAEARNALLRNFTLSAGMLQALLMMKLVDPHEALNVLMRENAETPVIPAVVPPPATVNPPMASSGPQTQNAVRPPQPVPLDPRQARMAQNQDPYARGHPAPVNAPYEPPQPPATTDATPNQSEMERATMLLQLIQMTDQQLASLPPDQRQAVMMLRDQLSRQI